MGERLAFRTGLGIVARAQEDGPGTWETLHLHAGRGRSPRGTTGAAVDGEEGVGGPHSNDEVGERLALGPGGVKAVGVGVELSEGNMADAMTSGSMSTALRKVMSRAQRDPGKILSLAHRIDVPALERAYHRLRKDAAVGVDGVTKSGYGQELERNLSGLHERLRSRRWRHQPIRRVYIPKEKGKTRPIGISTVEDKIVQDSIREVLETIYEQDFMDCSHGFRPGRRAHDALRSLNRSVHQGEAHWIIEADIVSFFDSLDRAKLMEMLRVRIGDRSLLRLVGNACTWAFWTGRSTPNRSRARHRGRCSRRFLATSICITCWICGSSVRSSRVFEAGLAWSVTRMIS